MTRKPVDRDVNYMKQMWGTTHLASDYRKEEKIVIQEIMHDDICKKHHLKEQTELHEKIRNDNDYDDWTYGTEPSFGKPQ